MLNMYTTLRMKNYRKGNRIELKQRGPGHVLFLKKGTMKIVNLYEDGEEIIKEIIKAGDIFGILGLLYGENLNDYAVAMEDTTISIVDTTTLKKMMREDPELNNYIFKLAGLRIKKLERKLESLVHRDAESRIEEFIKDYIREFGKREKHCFVAKNLLSDGDIGKLTSTSRQTVNRTLNRLRRNHQIDFDRKQLRISSWGNEQYINKHNEVWNVIAS